MFPFAFDASWFQKRWLAPRPARQPGPASRLLDALARLGTSGEAEDGVNPWRFPPF